MIKTFPHIFFRSDNIIEEENFGTTISGYKYTGRERRLDSNSHLAFKNIHM